MKYKITNFYYRNIFFFRNKLSLYYSASSKFPNFGDQLSLDIVNKFSKNNFKKSSLDNATLIAIGSILELFFLKDGEVFQQRPMRIWGSGFIAEEGKHHRLGKLKEYKFARPMKFAAVRGYHTLNRIRKMGYEGDIAVGDPGILSSSLVENNKTAKVYSLGLIPHYIDRDNPIFQIIHKKVERSIILDIFENPMLFLKKMLQCETILSSAMHGLIAADSLSIPNKWIKVSNKLHGGDYKFKDYYSVYGISEPTYFDKKIISTSSNIPAVIKTNYQIEKDRINEIKKNLLESCPFPQNL